MKGRSMQSTDKEQAILAASCGAVNDRMPVGLYADAGVALNVEAYDSGPKPFEPFFKILADKERGR